MNVLPSAVTVMYSYAYSLVRRARGGGASSGISGGRSAGRRGRRSRCVSAGATPQAKRRVFRPKGTLDTACLGE
jgi:hypothetical protein